MLRWNTSMQRTNRNLNLQLSKLLQTLKGIQEIETTVFFMQSFMLPRTFGGKLNSRKFGVTRDSQKIGFQCTLLENKDGKLLINILLTR